MPLAEWLAKGWLRQEEPDIEDIRDLLNDIETDLADARRDISPDWVFSTACAAAVNLCILLLKKSGYSTQESPELKALRALPMILGPERKADADYLESCLKLRKQLVNQVETSVSDKQSQALHQFVESFYLEVIEWLSDTNPCLVSNSDISIIRSPQDGLLL